MYLYRKYCSHTIILLCCNSHHYYYILSYIYIYKEGWLTNRLSLLIILNLYEPIRSFRIVL